VTLRRSWVAGANDPAGDFPLNNLALGVFTVAGEDPRCGVAIGERVLDVAAMERAGWLRLGDEQLLDLPYWNEVMEAGPTVWARLRTLLTGYLAEGAETRGEVEPFLHPRAGVTLHMPFLVAEFTDFYASRHHAFNVGSMFRDPQAALPPNWLHIPIGYNGRASSVVVSGTPVRRPWGQVRGAQDEAPRLAPSARFDFELELGAIVGRASDRPVTVAQAEDMIFGYVLLNDWSARDIQAWEYQPLGPFQSKATATTISPWIVMRAALAPFRVPTPPREVPLLPYLDEPGPLGHDLALSVSLRPERGEEAVIARTNARELYYSAPQQLAHHTLCGCPMSVGDLLGSGTVSGADREARGSLLELAWGGKEPLALPGGATRAFLQDGDTVTLRGHAQGEGFRVGFGDCAGRVVRALDAPYALP
jgi:fumarylacetoacetase